jgi:hypothetical protein
MSDLCTFVIGHTDVASWIFNTVLSKNKNNLLVLESSRLTAPLLLASSALEHKPHQHQGK